MKTTNCSGIILGVHIPLAYPKSKETDDILEILTKHEVEYDGDFSAVLTIKSKLYIDLFLYYRDTMPYEYQKARKEDPYVWIEVRLEGLFDILA